MVALNHILKNSVMALAAFTSYILLITIIIIIVIIIIINEIFEC